MDRLQEIPDEPVRSDARGAGVVSACYLSKVFYLARPKTVDRHYHSYRGTYDLRLKPLQRHAQRSNPDRSYWTVYELPAIALATPRRAILFVLPIEHSTPGDLKALKKLKYLPDTLSQCHGVLRPILHECAIFAATAPDAKVAQLPFQAHRMKVRYGRPVWRPEYYRTSLPDMLTATSKIVQLLQDSL